MKGYLSVNIEGELNINSDIYLIPEIKALKSSYDNVEEYLKYIYFVYDYNSPYISQPEEIRKSSVYKLVKNVDTNSNILIQAIKVYNEITKSPAEKLWEGSIKAAYKTEEYLNSVEINDKNIIAVTKALKDVPVIIENLIKMEKLVKENRSKSEIIRGNGEPGLFEL